MKKAKESQYLTSELNTPVLNYNVYIMKPVEKTFYIVLSAIIGGMVGLIFYSGLFKVDGFPTMATYISNVIVFLIFSAIAMRIYLPMRMRQLIAKRQSELKLQFRDMLESLAASFSSGANALDSFISAHGDLTTQYSEDSLIAVELKEIIQGMQNNIPVERLLKDLGERSGLDDIVSFGETFEICYRKGGNIKDVIRRTHDIISEKMAVMDEIETKLVSNKLQQKVMSVMPIVIVALLKFSSESFAENFASSSGVICITVAIVIFIGAYKLGEKIVDVKG